MVRSVKTTSTTTTHTRRLVCLADITGMTKSQLSMSTDQNMLHFTGDVIMLPHTLSFQSPETINSHTDL